MTSPSETLNLTERNIAKKLKHMGKKLLKALPSVDSLLELLDKLELVLSTVDQAPTKPIQESIVPAMKALISNELLQHSNEDVKISITSCISEITRITAPDVPYDDEQMKEIFKLIVAAFEKLSHVSGRGYLKALNILDNVSTVRLCLVMLDLECDDLVIEMFQHFLRFIRSNHPCKAIRSMESMMTLMLNESEDISSDLLRPLLDRVTNENQTISPISWTLGEKVISNCAVKLKPYLRKAVQLSGRALNEYAQVVASICENGSESPQRDHSNGSKQTVVQAVENMVDVPKDADEQPCDATEVEPDIARERDVQIVDDTKSNIRNAGASTIDGEAIKKSGSKRKPHSEITKNSKRSNAKANLETDNLQSAEEAKSETQLNTVPGKRGRKPNSLLNPEEGYDYSWIYRGTKTGKSTLSRKARNSSSAVQPSEQPTSRKDKLPPKPKTVGEALGYEKKSENIAKPAQSRRIHDIRSDFPPNENPASCKANLLSKPEDTSEGREAIASKPKTDENADAAPSFTNNNIADGCHTKRGRARKTSSNRDDNPSSVSLLKEDHLNPLHETSLASPGVRLEKESEVRKKSEVNPIRKIKFSIKIDGKTAVGPELVVTDMEPKVSSGDEGKCKSATNIELENIEGGRSSAQTEVKNRRRLNATPNKGLNKSSAPKELITESASKTLSGVKENTQARLRKHVTVSVQASESRDFGNSLVGSKIKVWWPIDRTFYEGVIDSYDPITGKHKILYTDGDVEVLNLKRQRWEHVAVDDSSDDEEGFALQKLAEASDMAEKIRENSEELAKDANIKSRSRGRASSSISISESVKSVGTSAADRSDSADESIDDHPITVGGQDSARKPKTKRMKTGSDIKRNKPKTGDLEKKKSASAVNFAAGNASKN